MPTKYSIKGSRADGLPWDYETLKAVNEMLFRYSKSYELAAQAALKFA